MAVDALATTWAPRVLSILRFMAGLMLLDHGTGKILKFPFVQRWANIDLSSMSGIAGYLELVGGALLVVGLFTRPVAFILSGMCAVAYFFAHAKTSFHPVLNNGEAAALYAFVLLYIAAAGGGPWSVDAMRNK